MRSNRLDLTRIDSNPNGIGRPESAFDATQAAHVQQEVGERAELQALEAKCPHPGELLPLGRTADERPSRQVRKREWGGGGGLVVATASG